MARWKWTSKQTRLEAIEAVKQGRRVIEVADEVGVKDITVYQWLKQEGITLSADSPHRRLNPRPPNGPTRKRRELYDTVIDLVINQGMSSHKAALTVGIAHSTAMSWLCDGGYDVVRGQGQHAARQRAMHAFCEQLLAYGLFMREAAEIIGVRESTVYDWRNNGHVTNQGAVRRRIKACFIGPVQPVRVGRGRRLTTHDRAAIAVLAKQGLSARAIGVELERHHSVIARELQRNGVRGIRRDGENILVYNPDRAAELDHIRGHRPKPHKLDNHLVLRRHVVEMLAKKISPGRIAARLRVLFPDDEAMHISHEAIYSALYIQTAGSLRTELEAVMNTDDVLIRAGKQRKARNRVAGLYNRSWVAGAQIIDRPPEADDRAVPGHWEGDLVIGKDHESALITLVERSSRFTLLGHLPGPRDSTTVIMALQKMISSLPTAVFETITWDQGSEMAKWKTLQIAQDCQVFFCDPHSPWQRPTNENTNGEIRRRFYPKGTAFQDVTAEHVQWVQNELNETPRQVLNGYTPSEILALQLGVAFTP